MKGAHKSFAARQNGRPITAFCRITAPELVSGVIIQAAFFVGFQPVILAIHLYADGKVAENLLRQGFNVSLN